MASSFIETFIAAKRGATKEDAFREFVALPRISEWAGADPSRVARLKDEFDRAWARMRASEADAAAEADAAPLAAKPAAAPARPAPAAPKAPAESAPRKPRVGKPVASVMCTSCGSMNLHAHLAGDAVLIKCASCDTVYRDLLELIPVKEVGPFEFVFGEGWKGVVTFVALLALVVAVGVALRWSS